jgi:hypothetical protein
MSQDKSVKDHPANKSKQIKHILSHGAGVNSTALMIFLIRKKFPLDGVVFADTGGELPETYEYLKIAQKYLSKHKIPFVIVKSKNGTLYDTCKRRRVIPSAIWRWSTRDYKITPIYAYYRSLDAHVNQYIAIAYDEIERIKDSRVDYVTNLYPLIDNKITRDGCIEIIKSAKLPVPPKSGCYFCPFNSIERWHELYTTHRNLYYKAIKLEENSKHFPKQRLTSLTLRQLKQSFQIRKELPVIQIESPCGSECMT